MRTYLFEIIDNDGDVWDVVTVTAPGLGAARKVAQAEAARLGFTSKVRFEG